MVSPEVNNFTHEPAATKTTTSAPLARTEKDAGIFNGWTQDYDDSDRYYSDATDETPESWQSENIQNQVTPIEYLKTEPLPAGNEEIDIVNNARTIDEALQQYKNRYPLADVDNGEKSPQRGAEMLLNIATKFDDTMTEETKKAIALDTIEMAIRIIELADKPAKQSPEWTNIKGLMEISQSISLAQSYAPEKVKTLKNGLQHVAEKVESRSPAITGPILIALKKFDENPDMPFDKILEQIEHKQLNDSNIQFELKDKDRQAQKEREKRLRSAREAGAVALAQIMETRDKEMMTSVSTQAGPTPTQVGTAAASLEDLYEDDDSKVSVGAGR